MPLVEYLNTIRTEYDHVEYKYSWCGEKKTDYIDSLLTTDTKLKLDVFQANIDSYTSNNDIDIRSNIFSDIMDILGPLYSRITYIQVIFVISEGITAHRNGIQ